MDFLTDFMEGVRDFRVVGDPLAAINRTVCKGLNTVVGHALDKRHGKRCRRILVPSQSPPY